MSNFYIYKFKYTEKLKGLEEIISATVIFCDQDKINDLKLASEINKYFEKNHQTDKIFVIARNVLESRLKEVFIDKLNDTFKGIPKRQDTHLEKNLYLLTFDKIGKLKIVHSKKKIPLGFEKNYLNEGLQNIFIERGGLVSSSKGTHHFVFPSGKHCDKFLRTGNVLIVSSEIYFIAFGLLKHFDESKHQQIYCDTSSINSIAFALSELKNRFQKPEDRNPYPIESFSSYEGLYKNEINYKKDALLLISASTSSNIISYILDLHSEIDRCNIIVLYYLGEEKGYLNIRDKVICNLTYSEKYNQNGIISYPTYKQENCQFCQKGSHPVSVKGDVFLLEQPKINRMLFTVKDADKKLSSFVEQFKSTNKTDSILKVHYKDERANKSDKYEIYIDYNKILENINEPQLENYKLKLDSYINQYVPSNTKYIVHLDDKSSENLAKYIVLKIKANYVKVPDIISQNDLTKIAKTSNGAILVVGSCISNGKNLLYISRALRIYDNLRIVYFTGITRTKNKQHLEFLKKNLKQGSYGSESSSFVEVESVFCENNSKNSSWLKEIEFLKKMIDFLKDTFVKSKKSQAYFDNRKKQLEMAGGTVHQGLSQNLFLPIVTTSEFKELEIRKNFAFFEFNDYVKDVTQSDIYFTISNIINGLRNSEKLDRTLTQSVHVRNIIDPGNFNRFNDGIIQSSILRAACPEELAYSIDSDLSSEMTGILETIIKYYKDEQGEAILEFLYAIAIEKLTLMKSDLLKLINLVDSNCKEEIILCFSNYIKDKILVDKTKLKLKPFNCL